ncbi:DNA-processing protein DprA [Actinoplanes sp. NPDC049118]|uniref:DNA-processing protein DprA n=1 Tax=Actinoplanes sp. NPDC049118 TaxID=3155769 RepID=UPI0033C37474
MTDDDTRTVLAALSYYVGGALPATLIASASAHGLSLGGWVYPASTASATNPGHPTTQLQSLGASLRERAADAGMTMLIRGDAGWPAGTGCDELPCVWVGGGSDIAARLHHAVAVIGSAASTAYGEYIAAELGRDITAAGATVVTAASVGISARAVGGVLTQSCGMPVVITPAGLDHRSSSGVSRLVDHAVRRGSVLSPFPPGRLPTRSRLRTSLRLIAAVSAATVVVEAFAASLPMEVARGAASAGRVVCAVPGPVTSGVSAGCHQLIADKTARLVTSASEVMASIAAARRTTVDVRGCADEAAADTTGNDREHR